MNILKRIFGKRDIINYNFSFEESQPWVDGYDARELYLTQANLHAVLSFRAASVAHLPLKVYKRQDENTRVRDRDSVAALLLYRPNADQTTYEFIEALTIEYDLFGEAVVMLLPDDSPSGWQMRIIPHDWIVGRTFINNYTLKTLKLCARNSGTTYDIPASEFIIFKMYSPGSPASYQSPINSLKQTLSEQIQASKFRTSIWRSSGRINAYITRPTGVKEWTPEARDAWIEAFRKGWSLGGQKAGSMPILEDGMEIKPYQFNAKEAQYAEAVQLTREDVAAAYHINPSLIWHTTTQTYASAKDNARALYSDCLGPLLQMFQQRINTFLLPKIGADPNTYVEFDLEEKLKGSFEERAEIFQRAAGVPYLTVNEVRAELNRPPIENGDERVIPLNVLVGGQASAQDSTPNSYSNQFSSATIEQKDLKAIEQKADQRSITITTKASDEDIEKFRSTLEKFFKRQEASISTKLKAVNEWWDKERWDRELKEDLHPIIKAQATKMGRKVANEIGSEYYEENTDKYLERVAETRADYINLNTYNALLAAQLTDKTVAEVFTDRIQAASTISEGLADSANEFGVKEAVEQAEFQKKIDKPTITREWVTGPNPRASHAAMNGEEVEGWNSTFSNGLKWPHDFGTPEETCGCNCSLAITLNY